MDRAQPPFHDSVSHGIQVFDLDKLKGLGTTQTFTADATFTGLTNSHTSPLRQVACYDREVYSHESIVQTYRGPDTRFTGHEIAFNYTGQGREFQIPDVTDKSDITVLSSVTHPGAGFVHQGFPTSTCTPTS